MKPFFKELFEYTHHFNQQVIAILNKQASPPEKSVKLISHTLNAQHIWNSRIIGVQPLYTVWQLTPASEWATIDKKNYETSIDLLDKVDFGQVISYVNSQGGAYSNSVRDILFHAINHSTYHRGQIATDLKEHGIAPPITDYIFYKR